MKRNISDKNMEFSNGPYTKEYIVEAIIDKRVINGSIFYKVKWLGYPLSKATWEPISHLENVQKLLEIFDRSTKNQPEVLIVVPKKLLLKNLPKKPFTSPQKASIRKQSEFAPLPDDLPVKVISASKEGDRISYEVMWRARGNGYVPPPSFVKSEFLKEKYPQLIIDFYELLTDFDYAQ